MIKNKLGKVSQGGTFLRITLFFALLGLFSPNFFAQGPFERMGIQAGDRLPQIRQKADAWFALNGEEGRKQFERWYSYNYTQVDEQGNFPSDLDMDQGFAQYQAARLSMELLYAQAKIPTPSWAEIKPSSRVSAGNLGDQQNFPGKGRVNCLRWDPASSSHWFCGTAGGGVWESTNAGGTWVPLMDGEEDLKYFEIKDMAVDRGAQNIYVLASSSINHTGETGGGSRLSDSFYRSTDGGASWEVIPIDASKTSISMNWVRILIDPVNPQYLYAAGYSNNALYRGLFRSTDHGDSWNQIMNNYSVRDMELQTFVDTTWVHLACYRPGSSGGQEVELKRYTYIHPSGGGAPSVSVTTRNFGVIDNPEQYQLAADFSNTVYFFIGFQAKLFLNKTRRALKLYRSENRGDTFAQVSISNPPTNGDGDVITARLGGMQVDPEDPDVIYLGAANVCRSEDGGQNWVNLKQYAPSLYVDHNDFQFWTPPMSETLLDINDSGIQQLVVTKDALGLLNISVSRKDQGLEALQCNNLGVSQKHPEHIMVGTHDNGSVLYDRSGPESTSATLKKMSGGDGQQCLVHKDNANLMFSSSQNGNTYKFTSASASSRSSSKNFDAAWNMPLQWDVNNASCLYATDYQIWRSTDQGDNWAVYSNSGQFSSSSKITHLAQSRKGEVFYAVSGGQFMVSRDKGKNWNNENGVSGMGVGNITSIEADPYSEGIVYLTTGGYGNKHVLMSVDSGKTFSNRGVGLPSIPFKCLSLDPDHKGEAYAGGEYGVYFNPDIQDSSSAWTLFGGHLPNVCPIDLEYNSETQFVYAVTTGRGLWRGKAQHYYDAYPYCTPLGTTRNKAMGISKADFMGPTGQEYFAFSSALNESYSRFEAQAGDARAAGSVLDLKLTPGGSSSPQRIRIWTDAGESGSFGTTPLAEFIVNGSSDERTLRLTVPTGYDTFRIRVGVDWQYSSGDLSPCGRSLYGEYEDYIIPID